MPSVFTLEGAAGLAAEVTTQAPEPDFFHRQGIVVGGLLAFALSLAVGGAIGGAAVFGMRKLGMVRR